MSYENKFEGWEQLKLSDMLVAYRKAKADNFFEDTFPSAIRFAEYEQDLLNNLKELLEKLINNAGFKDDSSLLGSCRLLPKKMRIEPKPDASTGHTHFSSSVRAFEHLSNVNHLVPEYRIVGDFPVEAHILSALWINMVGHKFDARLDDSAYGSRLRRIRNDELLDKEAPKRFHLSAVGSFNPYFEPYQRWRNDGLNAIRDEIGHGRDVIAVSLDLKSYYHQIDPAFLLSQRFLDEIGMDEEPWDLTSNDREFTEHLVALLVGWSEQASSFADKFRAEGSVHGGLAIGLTASRIISNVLLRKWDLLVKEKLSPVYYGRYVDDMFIVLRDPGTIADSSSFMKYLQGQLGVKLIKQQTKNKSPAVWGIDFGEDFQGRSRIELQADKQKLFILEGQAGLDLLDRIEKEIRDLSSEHRLMPAPDLLEDSTAVRVLSAVGAGGEEADTLRNADGLSIRRLSWSMQLRHVETLARDLPPKEWRAQREEFFLFAINHVLRPDSIFAHYQYLSRLMGFAVSLKEWREAEKILRYSMDALDKIQPFSDELMLINGVEIRNGWHSTSYVKASLRWAFTEASAKYYPIDLLFHEKPSAKAQRLAKLFVEQLFEVDILLLFDETYQFGCELDQFYEKAPLLALADLAKVPYKRLAHLANDGRKKSQAANLKDFRLWKAFGRTGLVNLDDMFEFLSRSQPVRLKKSSDHQAIFEPIVPILFPTRPLTASEITEYVPACVGLDSETRMSSEKLWARYVRALAGVWVNPDLLENAEVNASKNPEKPGLVHVNIGTEKAKSVVVGITNIAVDYDTWDANACGKPMLTFDRYARISELVNQAISTKPKPDYLLFPELSIPNEWVESISNRLLSAGISLIAGTEYRHYRNNLIHSDAYLALRDDRLGYPSSVRIRQPKLLPAVGEDKDLCSRFGKEWLEFGALSKPVYNHNGFHFGVMVCSELQNSKSRIAFQGEVDSLIVLSWNQDLETFASLIESAALDIHAYTVLVNNRTYGDSRVRAPSKKSFKRDLARLRGGQNDYCVTVELDLDKLRAFQSRAKRWVEENDPFKPVPEGFEISPSRRRDPPK